jgi:methionyl-tRNA formyltransferase
MALRIVLMGTGEFAVPTFRSLMDSPHQVVGVLTQPDKTGRGHHHHVNPIKELGIERNIPVFQPERVNRPEMLETLRSLQADVFVVAAYGQILKQALLDIPRLGAFNLHGSLLPRHRGAAPVQYSVWVGDQKTGVTMFRIEPSLDSGPMVGKVVTEIGPHETSGELMLRLAELSVSLTHQVLSELEAGTAVFERQNESEVTLAPKIDKLQGEIHWSLAARQIDCQVRAMQPWPRAYTWLLRENQAPLRCLILQATASDDTATEVVSADRVGALITDAGRLLVQTGQGRLQLLQIQPDGRKAVDALSFVNGYQLTSTSRMGSSHS